MLTFKEFINRIQSKTIAHHTRIFAFIGPERFLRNKGVKLIKSINSDLSKDTKLFQPNNFDSSLFLNELYSVPFLQQRKLIILNLSQPGPSVNDSVNQKDINNSLEKYVLAPSLFSLLIIVAEKWCLRPKLKDLLVKNNALLIECAKIPDHQLIRWVTTEIQSYDKTISLPVARSLIEQTGNDLAIIDEAIQKLILYAGKHRQIEHESVQKLVAQDREYDKKELVKAILSHQSYKALQIINRLIAEGNDTYQIVGYLAGVFKREPISLKARRKKIKTLLATDLSIKTGLTPEDRALQLLVTNLVRTG